MESTEPRLVALDLDGTLLDPAGRVTARARATLGALRARGVVVVLATGRSPWSAAPIAQQLGLNGPQILMQGGLVADPVTGRVLRAMTMPHALVEEQLAFARERALTPILGFADVYRSQRLGPEVLELSWPTYGEGAHLEIVDSLDAVAGNGVIRTFLFTSPARHAAIAVEAALRFGERASITWGDQFGIELLAAAVTKGSALEWLAGQLGLGMDDVAAVGDGRNDLEMLATAGRSAAMSTAPAAVRAAAGMVVPPSAEEGAFAALSTWFPWLPAAAEEAA